MVLCLIHIVLGLITMVLYLISMVLRLTSMALCLNFFAESSGAPDCPGPNRTVLLPAQTVAAMTGPDYFQARLPRRRKSLGEKQTVHKQFVGAKKVRAKVWIVGKQDHTAASGTLRNCHSLASKFFFVLG